MCADARQSAILEGLRSDNDLRQQEAAMELAELLLLGNEETLATLPVREVIQALSTLMHDNEYNLELVRHRTRCACEHVLFEHVQVLTITRCITNLIEALPRCMPLLLDMVPMLIEKLRKIECIDVAEQALTALEAISRRHGKTIMLAVSHIVSM